MIDPRDDSLLQDLLDGRLGEAEATDLRRRIGDNADLTERWDDLRRIGDLLRPDPSERAPRDFLTQVRTRIASTGNASTQVATEPAAEPAVPLPSHPRWRWTSTISAVAALLLATAAVRLLFLAPEPPVEPKTWERAARETTTGAQDQDAEPDAFEAEGIDRLSATTETRAAPAQSKEKKERSSPDVETGTPAGGVGASSPVPVEEPVKEPAGAPSPPPTPRMRSPSGRSVLRPGDAVEPGLRQPSEEIQPAPSMASPPSGPAPGPAPDAAPDAVAEAVAGGARSAGARGGGGSGRTSRRDAKRKALHDAPVYVLEAEGFEEGGARLALLLASPGVREQGGEAEEDAGGVVAGELVPSRQGEGLLLRFDRRSDASILGTVLLSLTRLQAERLAGHEAMDEDDDERVAVRVVVIRRRAPETGKPASAGKAE